MPCDDKIALLKVLDVGNLVEVLLGEGTQEGGERWEEKCAKVLGAVGGELCKICDEVGGALSLSLFPSLRFVHSDPYFCTRSPLLPSLLNQPPSTCSLPSSPSSSDSSPPPPAPSPPPSPPSLPPFSVCTGKRRSGSRSGTRSSRRRGGRS